MKKFLFQTTAYRDAAEDARIAREMQRASIQVTVSKPVKESQPAKEQETKTVETETTQTDDDENLRLASDDAGNDDDDKSGDDDGKSDTDGETTGEGEGDTQTEIDENKDTIKENKDEIKQLEAEKAKAKTDRERNRTQKRIDKLAAENKQKQTEIDELKRQLAAQPDKSLTPEEIERQSNNKADEKFLQRKFNDDCNKLWKDGQKLDKDFTTKVNELAQEVGLIPGAMIGVLSELDEGNGGAVLYHLINNPDDYEDIFDLFEAGKFVKAGSKIEKISEKLAEATKPKPKQISKVPAPMKGHVGNNAPSNNITITGRENMDDFVRKRNQQIAQKREAQKRGY